MLYYRRELDGLRALAVIAVIIYHANLKLCGVQLFQGGFFGVDVFFVLSGYLITGIIRSQMEQGTFSFRSFYWRRAKRIVPAFLTMLLITSGLAYLILLPDELVTYAKSLQSALYFGSNYFFYGEDSYNAAAGIYRPLLHTWSLSVEWQFYVVFPFIIWGINRFFPRYIFGILLALTLLSLQSSSFIVKFNPDMAFYLLPTRAWELILGGLVTFYNRTNVESSVKGSFAFIAYQSLPIIGMFFVVHSMIFIGHEVQHPSFITLLPVLGTCLFIMFSHKGEITSDIMSLKPIVGIGLVSYSLYLWHQPVFVFFRFIKHDYFRYEQFALLVIISLILSLLSYRFIEVLFRKENVSRYAYSLLAFFLFMNVMFNHLAVNSGGFPARLGNSSKAITNLNAVGKFKLNDKICFRVDFEDACFSEGEGRNVILVGDSHASVLSHYIYDYTVQQGWSYLELTESGCTGLDSVTRYTQNAPEGDIIEAASCTAKSKLISKYIESKETPRSTIIFHARLPLYLDGRFFDNQAGGVEPGYKAWIDSNEGLTAFDSVRNKLNLWAALGHELVLVYPVPEVGWNVPHLVKKEISKYVLPRSKSEAVEKYEISTSYDLYKERVKESYDLLNSIYGDNVIRVYPSDVFCKNEKCLAKTNSILLYSDDNHLSTYGAKLLVSKISESLP